MTRPPRTTHRYSLRRVVDVATAALTVLLLGSIVVAALALQSLTSARAELIDELGPAQVASAQLLAATVDEQNRLRGYILLGTDDKLEDLLRERTRAEAREQVLSDLLVGRSDLLDQLDVAVGARTDWEQQHVAGTVAAVANDEAVTDAQIRASSAAFDEIRFALEDLDELVEERASSARAELVDAARRLTASLVVSALLLLVGVVGIWLGLRRMVLAPLAHTVDDARTISAGGLDHEPLLSGPSELVEVAEALDRVRVALVEQLREVESREADLARSNAELEQFAYVASHDLQEPLRKVASFCQMLQRRYEGQLDERADTYIGFAVDGAKRMQDLINDLLSFSRVGRTTERFETVDLDDVVDRAIGNLSNAIDDAAAVVERRGRLGTVEGDRSLLTALFQNLVGNAIKFRDVDRPEVIIGAVDLGDRVEVEVSDNGIGIPEEYRDRIFVIFQRLHGRAEYEGTGIGLALCRKIVEFHGGRIAAEPGADGGTTFRFTLMRRPDQVDAARPDDAEPIHQAAVTAAANQGPTE